MVALSSYVLALAISIASVQAAPTPYTAGPSLFTHDPYSIHRRSIPANLVRRDDSSLDGAELSAVDVELQEDDIAGEEFRQLSTSKAESCSQECGLIKIPGVRSEREALCSDLGLESTRACAECIDTTWPNARFQQSAMSEYEKILSTCGVKSA